MKIEITGKGYNISPRLKRILEEKIERLSKYFDDLCVFKVVCREDGKINKMEITAFNKGVYFRSQADSENMFDNIDITLSKITRQIEKVNGKKKTKSKGLKDLSIPEISENPYNTEKSEKNEVELVSGIVKIKTFELSPMSPIEAEMRLELLDHDFYVFLNEETSKVSILYRRHDGGYGLINTIH